MFAIFHSISRHASWNLAGDLWHFHELPLTILTICCINMIPYRRTLVGHMMAIRWGVDRIEIFITIFSPSSHLFSFSLCFCVDWLEAQKSVGEQHEQYGRAWHRSTWILSVCRVGYSQCASWATWKILPMLCWTVSFTQFFHRSEYMAHCCAWTRWSELQNCKFHILSFFSRPQAIPTSSSTSPSVVRLCSTPSTWSSPASASRICPCSSSICQLILARKWPSASAFFSRRPCSSCWYPKSYRQHRWHCHCLENICSSPWCWWGCRWWWR